MDIKQVTHGPRHHFFGYIGHCRTIPWSGDNRYMLCLETSFQDRMPTADDAAGVMLIDTSNGFAAERLDESRAWNPQQGTMFYWDPAQPESRFFFNDRDPATGKVFTVLYDLHKRRRIVEYRFEDTPVANGGVAQGGGAFMAINYGRLARLRAVTGYPGAYDWTVAEGVPADDGVFRVDVQTGAKRLVCSFVQLRDALLAERVVREGDTLQLFINHTLWNREGDRVLFFARSGSMWGHGDAVNVNAAFTMRPDGGDLTCHGSVGGHPEWAPASQLIVAKDQGLKLYDVTRKTYGPDIGDRRIFTDAKGDKALSPDARWLVHGNLVRQPEGEFHEYVFYRLADGSHVASPRFARGRYTEGPLRLDAAPCWDRSGTQVVVPAMAADGTRQMFTIRLTP